MSFKHLRKFFLGFRMISDNTQNVKLSYCSCSHAATKEMRIDLVRPSADRSRDVPVTKRNRNSARSSSCKAGWAVRPPCAAWAAPRPCRARRRRSRYPPAPPA